MRWVIEFAFVLTSLWIAYLIMLVLWPIITFYIDALNSMAP